MKGNLAASAPSKRRSKGFAFTVIVLVFLSLLVPLGFLLGLHNRFPYGHPTEDRWSLSSAFGRIEKTVQKDDLSTVEGDPTGDVDNPSRFGPSISKDDGEPSKTKVGDDNTTSFAAHSPPKDLQSQGETASRQDELKFPLGREKIDKPAQKVLGTDGGEPEAGAENLCQFRLGSYCLWSAHNKEKMQDFLVKEMKDQLFVARSLYPSIAKHQSAEKLSIELRQNIQEHEKMLSDALVDADLSSNAQKQVQSMDGLIKKVRSFHLGCFNVNKKLQQILDLTEDELNFHRRQSAFLYRVGVQTLPKSHHCLPMTLTFEYFNSPPSDLDEAYSKRFLDPALHHFVIYSTNVLAASVAVNSTVMNSKETETLVFHILTDTQNFFSIKLWFSTNEFKKALIRVVDIEDYVQNNSKWVKPHLSLSEEYRISVQKADRSSSQLNMRTEYISAPGHLYFFLGDIFKSLNRIIVLDDDVVVQRDLSLLWNVDLKNKVSAAAEFCRVRLGDLESHLGVKHYDRDACLWLTGLNVIDLDKWRTLGVTRSYKKLLNKVASARSEDTSWRLAALPASLLALQDLVHVLDDSWVLSGLGTDFSIKAKSIEKVAILHYNGNMKPWLELGIPKYKSYWKRYLPQGNRFMEQCNVGR
ncbi:galacturonosyltransferase 7 [Wolffia australiana]